MNMSTLCRMGAAVLIMSLIGCAPARMSLKPSFWKETQLKVGVATLPPQKFAAYRAGSEGLMDMAINSAMSDSLEAHLQRMDASKFAAVADQYVERLTERGLNARKLDKPVNPNLLRSFTAPGSGEFAEKDMRPLAEKEDIDMLILLSLQQCGTIRKYYGFIPLGAPEAICVSKGEMINLKTNEIAWRAYPEMSDAILPIEGDWDQAPDYRNVTRAVDRAMSQAQLFLLKEFFGSARSGAAVSQSRR
ncbi:hypothetical protein F0U62_06875 [Cystobacter fuscus]|uniref:hypothetical protein n=1 Tax=Cystobacter fuscus TaxID=43 RepID=UPI002B2A6151|nr:hypothetical protein F0U62_06875 [Cystobacter fuscus]